MFLGVGMSDLYYDEGDLSEDYVEDDEHDRDSGYASEGGFTTGRIHILQTLVESGH